MGDPAGIGPEIILKALARARGARRRRRAVADHLRHAAAAMADAARALGLEVTLRRAAASCALARASALVECGDAEAADPLATHRRRGRPARLRRDRARRPDAMAGRDRRHRHRADLNKEAINLAGYAYAGHTDMLADLTGSRDTCMMLAHGKLRVTHVSTHVALAKVPSLVTPERITPRPRADPRCAPSLRHREAAHRRRRAQPACRRGRAVRPRGRRGDRADGRGLPRSAART